MKKSHHRIERVNAVIKEILSEIVLRDVKDPRVGLVTVTGVNTAADLSAARVFFSVMGDEAQRQITLKILRGASGYMRHTIARELDVKVAPELRWVYDDSLDRAFRIEQALQEAGGATETAADIAPEEESADDGEEE
jgi:ribosome-binding factor A